MKLGIVVSGLPASGKTTVARALARGLRFAFLDKDDFLEALYERHSVETWDDRKALSRRSDVQFQEAAQKGGSCVLVSHWRPRGDTGESGTATDWLSGTYDRMIEVHCKCAPEVALERFRSRRRHPGHLDRTRDVRALRDNFNRWVDMYPLGLGPVVSVETQSAVDMDALLQNVQAMLDAH